MLCDRRTDGLQTQRHRRLLVNSVSTYRKLRYENFRFRTAAMLLPASVEIGHIGYASVDIGDPGNLGAGFGILSLSQIYTLYVKYSASGLTAPF